MRSRQQDQVGGHYVDGIGDGQKLEYVEDTLPQRRQLRHWPITAGFIAGAVIISGVAGVIALTAGHPPARPAATVAGCTAAFVDQIKYSEAHNLTNPDLPLPQACVGLTSAQQQEAAWESVLKTMPTG